MVWCNVVPCNVSQPQACRVFDVQFRWSNPNPNPNPIQVAMSGRGKGRTNAKDLQAILASLLANTGDGEESVCMSTKFVIFIGAVYPVQTDVFQQSCKSNHYLMNRCLIQSQEPTLGSILSQQSPCFVDEGDTVTSAAIAIAKEKKAVRCSPSALRDCSSQMHKFQGSFSATTGERDAHRCARFYW